MIICSKRCAIGCSMLSVWAIAMLTVMGVLMYAHAVAFSEDLGLKEVTEMGNMKEFIAIAYKRYSNGAHNCWIAACLYIATLAFSLHQYYLNRKVQYGI